MAWVQAACAHVQAGRGCDVAEKQLGVVRSKRGQCNQSKGCVTALWEACDPEATALSSHQPQGGHRVDVK